MERTDKNNGGGQVDPIVPIDFSPNIDKGHAFSLQLGWRHLFLALFLALSASAVWFIVTAKSVFIEIDPLSAEIQIEGGLSFRLGQRYLIREGVYEATFINPGYHDLTTNLFVTQEQSQTHPIQMQRLPGLVTIEVLGIDGARIQVDGVDVGETPLIDASIEAGERELLISAERYIPTSDKISVEGREIKERFEFELDPAWATVSVTSQPTGAQVLVDGNLVGVTPLNTDVLQGEREFTVKLSGHKAWQDYYEIVAGEDIAVTGVELEPADGLIFIRSNPSDASVTIGNTFRGQTPLEVAITPSERHQITLFKAGYEPISRTIETSPDEETSLSLELVPIVAKVLVAAEPEDAELFVNGEYLGLANQTIELMAISQQIEIRREGYVPYATEFTSRPGFDQEIRVSLTSLEQQRLEQIKPLINTVAGETLKLFYPSNFTMGASRREAGRRPNEALREVTLKKPFYISVNEVTNASFKLFRPDHAPGTFRNQPLGLNAQPVVQVSWLDAAQYCNWLSAQEGLPAFYQIQDDELTGFDPDSTGYRLPTEAEWAWIARTNDSDAELKYTWGDQLPPSENSGNFADVSAQAYLGEVLFNFNDGFIGSSPVGEFEPNYHDIYDMSGNVSEWVHDFYGSVGSLGGGAEVDPLGLESGQYHTIRGSSWAHGSITELRLSFRDFGDSPRDDLGFRIARYLGD